MKTIPWIRSLNVLNIKAQRRWHRSSFASRRFGVILTRMSKSFKISRPISVHRSQLQTISYHLVISNVACESEERRASTCVESQYYELNGALALNAIYPVCLRRPRFGRGHRIMTCRKRGFETETAFVWISLLRRVESGYSIVSSVPRCSPLLTLGGPQ